MARRRAVWLKPHSDQLGTFSWEDNWCLNIAKPIVSTRSTPYALALSRLRTTQAPLSLFATQ